MKKYEIGQLIMSAFPGTGKSEYLRQGEGSGYMPQGFACDSDSSNFDKSEFPSNYIEHIKSKIDDGYARIFVSSHKEVREALLKNEIEFTLVYPDRELKEEYLRRYKERGSSESFINLISNNWDLWLTELENQTGCKHIVLKSNQFISNIC